MRKKGIVEADSFQGRWRINAMKLWDRDYFDMDVKAFIEIGRGRSGDFQFGLVAGDIDWRVAAGPDGKRSEK